MIIKSKRIRARGQALSRTLRHVIDGDDNDRVLLVRGNVADLQDARGDALRFGREFAVRHWILSPAQGISPDQLSDLVVRLSAEFGFDPDRAVIWKHWKDRASASASDEHYHLMCPEIDPLTGGVMSSSHNYARHEKLSRVAELSWGHNIVHGKHVAAVVAALDREGRTNAADALRNIAPVDHPQSYGEREQQRLKRGGFDLPRLREMVSEALSAASDRADLDARLAAVGLRLRAGDRKDIPIVEAMGTEPLSAHSRVWPECAKTLLRKGCNSTQQQPTQQPKQKRTIHEATYLLVRRLAQQMEPLSKVASAAEPVGQPNAIDIMIALLQKSVEGIEQIHSRLEHLEARKDEPTVTRTLKDAVHG